MASEGLISSDPLTLPAILRVSTVGDILRQEMAILRSEMSVTWGDLQQMAPYERISLLNLYIAQRKQEEEERRQLQEQIGTNPEIASTPSPFL